MKKIWYVPVVSLVYIVGFLLFAYVRLAAFHPGTQSPQTPLFSFVEQVRTNGTYVYALDDVCERIYKYSPNGELCSVIRLPSFGANIIFFDEHGNLCRNDYKGDKLYVYDDSDQVIETYDWNWYGDEECPVPIIDHAGELECKYNNRILFNSTIVVSDGETEFEFPVEYWGVHLFSFAAAILFVTLFCLIAILVLDVSNGKNMWWH